PRAAGRTGQAGARVPGRGGALRRRGSLVRGDRCHPGGETGYRAKQDPPGTGRAARRAGAPPGRRAGHDEGRSGGRGMTGGRRFSLSSPDWGQAHLTLDAIVAYVDDELSTVAHARAQAHLECCGECRAEVVAQRQARTALRGAGGPNLPSSLLHSLRSIPVEAELPPMPPGLGVTADGQFVLLRDVPQAPPDPAFHGPARPG